MDAEHDDPDAVRARLDRIDALDRREVSPFELIAELRGLLRDADLPVAHAKEVVERLHTAPHRT